MVTHFILYVRDQDRSTAFYREIFDKQPTLNVPGMTEFRLGESCILGLMPEKGIKKLLGNQISDPEESSGVSRAEIYLRLERPNEFMKRAIRAGARVVSDFQLREWGDEAGYVLDPDGHVIAFAKLIGVL